MRWNDNSQRKRDAIPKRQFRPVISLAKQNARSSRPAQDLAPSCKVRRQALQRRRNPISLQLDRERRRRGTARVQHATQHVVAPAEVVMQRGRPVRADEGENVHIA